MLRRTLLLAVVFLGTAGVGYAGDGDFKWEDNDIDITVTPHQYKWKAEIWHDQSESDMVATWGAGHTLVVQMQIAKLGEGGTITWSDWSAAAPMTPQEPPGMGYMGFWYMPGWFVMPPSNPIPAGRRYRALIWHSTTHNVVWTGPVTTGD